MHSSLKLPFAILCAVPFIMVLGNSMLIPLLPKMRAAMDLNLVEVGLLITAFSLPAGFTIPFAGFLSDRTSRKLVMAPALVIYGLGGLLAGLAALFMASPYYLILGGRVIQGFGAGGTYQLAMALTGDIFQTKERTKALGLLEASNGLGKVVSPVAGASLGLIGWFTPFFAYGFLAIPIGIAVWLMVKEPRQESKKQLTLTQYFATVKEIFRKKGVSLLGCFLSGMMVLFILFGVLSFVSDVLEARYHITGLTMGLLIAIPVSAMTLTSYLNNLLLAY
ncbi:MAG: transporter, family, multidrug resistance protein [Clostridia bacterium]|nr:transporter, family, multidrug resistance protein [Clostridia bacterium]